MHHARVLAVHTRGEATWPSRSPPDAIDCGMTDGGDGGELASKLAGVEALLESSGYAVIDNALSISLAAELLAAMEELRSGGGLRQHRFGVRSASGTTRILTKPHIYEAEIDDEAVRRLTPHLVAMLARFGIGMHSAARVAFPSLGISEAAPTYKLQCNEGGCFPLHYDNAGPPSRRRLTALFYLNPGWADGHGGELQLVPWLTPPVTLAPLHNRVPRRGSNALLTEPSVLILHVRSLVWAGLVLFLSDSVLHRVMPCHARRFCFTIWLDGEGTNDPASLRLDARVSPWEMRLLDPATRLLSRAVYAEAYAASIRECFADQPEQCADMLASHDAHVAQSMANPALARLVNGTREKLRELDHQPASSQPLAAASSQPLAASHGGESRDAQFAVTLAVRPLSASRVKARVLIRRSTNGISASA